jgi:hypothetical protein
LEEARGILGAQGFDTATLELLDDGNVLVEGDMIMNLEAILGAGTRVVEKGYWHHWLFQQKAPASNVALLLEDDLPEVWKTAFRAAAAQWSAISGIDIAEDGGGIPFLRVRYVTRYLGFPPNLTQALLHGLNTRPGI